MVQVVIRCHAIRELQTRSLDATRSAEQTDMWKRLRRWTKTVNEGSRTELRSSDPIL